jgi:tetratricopeptide (TPR) repeat protein
MLRSALLRGGFLERGLVAAREAVELAGGLDDPQRRAAAAGALGNALWLAGRSADAVQAGSEALALADACHDANVEAAARFYAGQFDVVIGDYGQAVATLKAGLEICSQNPGLAVSPASPNNSTEISLHSWLAIALAYRGGFDEAVDVGQYPVTLSEQVGSPVSIITARYGLAFAHLYRGEFTSAIELLQPTLELCESLAIGMWIPPYAACLGYAFALRGQLGNARTMLRYALDLAPTRNRVLEATWLAWLGELQLLCGDVREAATTARASLDLARSRGERGNEALALKLHGDVAAAERESAVDSGNAYRAALALAEPLEARPLLAHCHTGLARLYGNTEKREQAKQHLETATTMYRDMGMTYWLEKAGAEMREIR